MKIVYLDCFSGISGDMVLGAFLDAGLPLADLKRALGSLTLPDIDVTATAVLRAGISATKFSVHENLAASARAEHRHEPGHEHQRENADDRHGREDRPLEHAHRSLPEIFALIDRAALSPAGRDKAKGMFQRLAEAEAAIHQMPVDKVHLHEVGAIDSIVDIVGAVYALEWVGADRIVCSSLNVGGGTVNSAHGRFPVPAPATLKLLTESGAPLYAGRVREELVTPTGALIATSYAAAFGPMPPMLVERVGYGAGDRDPRDTPNVLRIIIGKEAASGEGERVAVTECEIDDMNPQIYGVLMERLYAAGALEVFYVAVQMKKNRPGTLLTVVSHPERRAALTDIIFRESTTIGVRYSVVDRECLSREIVTVDTPLGPVRFKIARRAGVVVNQVPEFEDCAKIAAASDLAVKEVQAIAIQAYGALHRSAVAD